MKGGSHLQPALFAFKEFCARKKENGQLDTQQDAKKKIAKMPTRKMLPKSSIFLRH